jgi:predicted aconitase
MYLTREENEMLEGKLGYPVQKAMEIMVGLGECYDAPRMIPVASSHLVAGFKMGKAAPLLYEEMASQGGQFVTFTDTNPTG